MKAALTVATLGALLSGSVAQVPAPAPAAPVGNITPAAPGPLTEIAPVQSATPPQPEQPQPPQPTQPQPPQPTQPQPPQQTQPQPQPGQTPPPPQPGGFVPGAPTTPAPAPGPVEPAIPKGPGRKVIKGSVWTEENPMPFGISDTTCAVYNDGESDKIYILGLGDIKEATEATIIFDPETEEYTTGPVLNRQGGGHFSATITKDAPPPSTNKTSHLYVVGGYTAQGNSGLGGSVQRFGPDVNNNPPPYRWDSNFEIGPKNVGLAAGAVINGNIHICGGYDDRAKGTAKECSVFDTTGFKWFEGTPSLQQGVHKACYGSDGKKMWIAGGRTKGIAKFSQIDVTPLVQVYDPKNTSVAESATPQPRSGYISGFAQGRMICMGGEIQGNFTAEQAEAIGLDPNNNVFLRTDLYDPVADEWSVGTPPPIGMHSGCSVVYQDRLFVFGGKVAAGGGKGKTLKRAFSIALDDLFDGAAPLAVAAPGPAPSSLVVPLDTPAPAPTMPAPAPSGPVPAPDTPAPGPGTDIKAPAPTPSAAGPAPSTVTTTPTPAPEAGTPEPTTDFLQTPAEEPVEAEEPDSVVPQVSEEPEEAPEPQDDMEEVDPPAPAPLSPRERRQQERRERAAAEGPTVEDPEEEVEEPEPEEDDPVEEEVPAPEPADLVEAEGEEGAGGGLGSAVDGESTTQTDDTAAPTPDDMAFGMASSLLTLAAAGAGLIAVLV